MQNQEQDEAEHDTVDLTVYEKDAYLPCRTAKEINSQNNTLTDAVKSNILIVAKNRHENESIQDVH